MRRNSWIIPLGLFALLIAGAVLLTPRVREAGPGPAGNDRLGSDSLVSGRHYGPYLADSLLMLVRQADPGGALCRVERTQEGITFLKSPAALERKFNRVFFNKRSWEDMAGLGNLPIEMIQEGKDYGFRAGLEEIEGRQYLVLPHGVVLGLIRELGGKE